MFKNHFLCTTLFFVCSYFALHGSDRGTMHVTVTNNPSFPIEIKLADKISQINILAQRSNLQQGTISIKVDNEPSETGTLKSLEKYPKIHDSIQRVLMDILSNTQPFFHIQKQSESGQEQAAYKSLSYAFDNLFNYHWTVLPSSGNMNLETLQLKYPKGTTALGLKHIIYEQLAKAKVETEIKNKMYNILIKLDTLPLKDNDLMENIDELSVQESQSFSLALNKTMFQFFYADNTFKLSFFNPPCLSIDEKPIIDDFAINLQNIDKTDTKINVKYDGQEASTVVSDANFVNHLNKYYTKNKQSINTLLRNETELQQQLTFFITALIKWAKKTNKEVTFQGISLVAIPSSEQPAWFPMGRINLRPPSEQPSWFSMVGRIPYNLFLMVGRTTNNLFSTGGRIMNNSFSTILSTIRRYSFPIGVASIVGTLALYKNWFPGFPGVKFTSTPRTSPQPPAMSGVPK